MSEPEAEEPGHADGRPASQSELDAQTAQRLSVAWSMGFAGAGVGWLVGLSATPVLQGVLTSLLGIVTAVAAVAAGVKLDGTPASTTGKILKGVQPVPIAALSVGLALASSVAAYVRANDYLGVQPLTVAERWVSEQTRRSERATHARDAGDAQPAPAQHEQSASAEQLGAAQAKQAEAGEAEQPDGGQAEQLAGAEEQAQPSAQDPQPPEAPQGGQPRVPASAEDAERDEAPPELTTADVVRRLFDRRYPPGGQAGGQDGAAAVDASLAGILQAGNVRLCERIRGRLVHDEYGSPGEDSVGDLRELLGRVCPR